MSEIKHTAGPWSWDGNVCDYDPVNEAPWLVGDYQRGPAILTGNIKCDNKANARLIAAAPDLLEALEALADEIDVIVYEDNIVGPESLGKARAALAKARGEQ